VEILEQQGRPVILPEVSHQLANRAAANIVRPFSSRVIGIKALRRQPEAPELAARAAADNLEVKVQAAVHLDQVSGVRRQVIRRSHRHEQVLPQALLPAVHQHQEAMVAVAVKAVVQADQAVDYNKKKWSNVIL